MLKSACFFLMLLPGLLASTLQAAPAVTVELLEIDPQYQAELPLNAALRARIRYSTDRPVRLYLSPYRDGREVKEGQISSASPLWPAGSGEAITWVEFRSPQRIDELRVEAIGDGSIVLAQASLERPLAWFDGAAAAPPPAAWVEPLLQASRAQARAHVSTSDSAGGMFLTGVLFYLVPISVILQIVAWRKLEGVYGRLARYSAFAMAALWLFVLVTALAGSNLSPIWLVFLSPLFVVFLTALFVMQYLGRRRPA